MNEDPTKNLPPRSFEERVLAELAAIRGDLTDLRGELADLRTQQEAMANNIALLDQRLTSLEERVDKRLQETRPIWEAIQEQVRKLDQKFDLVIKDLYEMRADVRDHERRLTELENRPS